ncbi:alpha/beta fold hydrolase [Dactylosporangium sp. CS-033363]|uniref:alpha/beta fold hydrolase n=1 Tax=Dactylosporangium sp. CS-033363 TaxID=3239935 RepID=UPI003D8F56A4
MTETRTLEAPGATITYDVRGPLPPTDGHLPLVMIGQPMSAEGFTSLAANFPDRTVITYDPRGLGRSVRTDGRTDNTAEQQAADLHLLVATLTTGQVDVFASSGGAVTALEWVRAHPDDIATLVAHEPPLNRILPDAEAVDRARAAFNEAYESKGMGAGMAAFLVMTSWQGEFTDEYFAQPLPDPAAFGMPAEDDGSRNDPLLSKVSWPVSDYLPDVAALKAAPTRIVIAVGEESAGTYTARTAEAMAALLDQQPTVFPSHHGGFIGGEFGYAGKPEEFATKLREVLATP